MRHLSGSRKIYAFGSLILGVLLLLWPVSALRMVAYAAGIIVMAGGVASNSRLRYLMETKAGARGIEILKPCPLLCTDNGAMIASAAYYEYRSGGRTGLDLDAVPGLEF